MKLSATICLLLMVASCASTKPEIKYVERIVEVSVKAPPQLVEPCDVSQRSGNKVRDYIVSERRLRNDLAICNLMIEARNKAERFVEGKEYERMEGMEYHIKK